MRILFSGDVYGKAGRQVLYDHMPQLKEEFGADFVVINGENLADGRGLTEKTSKPLLNLGVDAITGGNHLWDRGDSWDYIRSNPAIVKALNFPDTTPGNPSCTIVKGDKQLTVITLCGQMFMAPCDSPFIALERWLEANPDRSKCVLLDFHAESTAEKRALAWFADGHVSALLGTHTHIQTADEEILPLGTAYITDVGMTGAHDSVIGVKKNIIIDKFRHALPSRYESSDQGLQINAVYLELDPATGQALRIERIRRPVNLPAIATE
ncbi:MAG: TIGR00282 family metallophosphoesterase [Candidatus Syntrophosphaera sp.]|nr:TIGR00282 family metallophosphoesterase [Candidatus Syntrophosphaera sp.]